jgi:ABC-type uncharacterized transport system substrate-binding protein
MTHLTEQNPSMKMKSGKSKNIGAVLLFFMLSLHVIGCNQERNDRKAVVYINSYHRGHPSSDEIMDAVIESFPRDSFDLASFFMDTKRNPSQEHIENVAAQLIDSVERIGPDILIVSDDNAVKYVVQPLVKSQDLPVVFCGVNGSDSEYNLPRSRVTGMLEILPVEEAVAAVQRHRPNEKRLLVLNENTTTSRKEAVLLDTMYRRLGVQVTHNLVDDFEQWKAVFAEANGQYDFMYVVTHGAIAGWDHTEAVAWVRQYIQIPVFTCEDFMMPYAVLGVAKVATEQGIWAARAAKKILKGKSPEDIPVASNRMTTVWLNDYLAEKVGFEPDSDLAARAQVVE